MGEIISESWARSKAVHPGEIIGIRTLLMQGKHAYLQAGAGIVADSDPAREYEESMNKAQALLKAVEMARSSGQ